MNLKRRLFSSAALSSLAAASAVTFSTPAYANCVLTGVVYTCSPAVLNPHTTIVGTGRTDNSVTVDVESDATIATSGTNAISVGDNVNITVAAGGTVQNIANTGSLGQYGTGANTIEFGSNGTLAVVAGGSVVKTGSANQAEAVNVHGFGNLILNYGLIQAENSAAIWFQDEVNGAKNVVDNYGTIERVGGNGSVIGASGTSGIVFRNQTGATVVGNIAFAAGNDDLYFYAGSTVTGSINGGGGTNTLTLEGAAGSDDTLTGAITNFSTLTKDGDGSWTVSGSLSGFTSVTVKDGTLALTGNNLGYTGSVLINPEGTLEARAQSLPVRALPAQDIENVVNNGLLRFTQTDDGAYVGQITGTGLVEKTGAGVLQLSPNAAAGNLYTGGTLITQGTLAISADNQIGASTGALQFNGGTLRFDADFDLSSTRAISLLANGGTINTNGQNIDIAQAIDGAGGLVKTGSGSLTLAGNNSYAGTTQVLAGSLYVNGQQTAGTGDTTVASGATIGGIGLIGGDLTIADGATLAPGQAAGAAGTLTVAGDLNLSQGSLLSYNFGKANVVGGALNDLTIVQGDLVLDGTLNVATTDGGTFGPGIYRVISYTGELTNNGLEIGDIPSPDFFVQTSVANQVNLVNAAGLNLNVWDGAGTLNDGTVSGGNGTWQNSNGNENWTTADGGINAPWGDAAFAIFTGAPGTVTIDNDLGDVKASGMQFAVDGYIVEGDTLNLVGPDSIMRVGDGTADSAGYSATINSVIAGDSQLVKTDAGTLILNGENSYTGGTAINGGTIAISNDNALGAVNTTLSFDGGTLRLDDAVTISPDREILLNAGGGTIDTNGHDFLITQGITGTGGLSLTGGKTVTLAGANSYEGATNLLTGTLTVTAPGTLSNQSTLITAAGTTVALAGHDQTIGGLTHGGLLTMGTAPGTALTVDGDYIGNGGNIVINTVLGGDDSLTDLLVVTGDTSGSSSITVNNVGGTGAPTVEGIKLVDVGGVSDGAFTLVGNYAVGGEQAVVTGAYVYRLYQNGVTDPADGDWYLRSVAGEGDNLTPYYQPAVPIHEAYAENLQALSELPTMQQRVGNRQWAQGTAASMIDSASGLWGRMTGSRARPEGNVSSSGADIDTDSWKAQIGVDASLSESENGQALIAGLNGYYGDATSDVASFFGNGRIKTKGYGVGGTLTYHGARGFYADAQAQFSWFESDLTSDSLGPIVTNNGGRGQAFSLELGRRALISDTMSLTPQVQMVYSNVDFDDYTDPLGADASSSKGASLKSRWGLSLDSQKSWTTTGGDARNTHYYALANLTYEWLDGSRTMVSGAQIDHENDRLWSELGVGASYSWTSSAKIYFEAQAATPINNFGDHYTLKGVAGFRLAL